MIPLRLSLTWLGLTAKNLKQFFDKFPDLETTYNLSQPDGGRIRVLLQEEQREALQTVKRYRHVSHEQLAEIAKEPQAYFDPDVVELDSTDETPSFSERVREIGIYQPRIYPFVSPYKSQWIPGILIDDGTETQTKIQIKTETELKKLQQAIEETKQANQTHVTWEGKKLPLSEVEQHLPFIEKQLKHRKKPSRTPDKKPYEKSETLVLIIEENIEDPDYVEKPDPPVEEPFRHLLEPPSNLKKEFKLLPHQEEGLAWAQQLWKKEYPGGLLADDMGLGKRYKCSAFWNGITRNFVCKNHNENRT